MSETVNRLLSLQVSRFGSLLRGTAIQAELSWIAAHPMPAEITADFLINNEAPPRIISSLRALVRQPLLHDQHISNTESIVGDLAQRGFASVGAVQEVPTDGNRTTDYKVPLLDRDGNVFFVVFNSAWGVHWELDKNHPLALREQKLARYQAENISNSKSDNYIAPEQLVRVVEMLGKSPQEMAVDIKDLISGVLEYPGVQVLSRHRQLGIEHVDRTTDTVEIVLPEGLTTILTIGKKSGDKSVIIIKDHPVENNPRYNQLVEKAEQVRFYIESFNPI